MWHALFDLVATGRLDEALKFAKKSRELDPLNPPPNSSVGITLYYQRNYDAAHRDLLKTLELDPNVPVVQYYLGKTCVKKGLHEEAVRWFQKTREALPTNGPMIGGLGYAYGAWGKRAEAEALIAEMERLTAGAYIPANAFAMIHIGLGETEKAIEWLEKACEERSCYVTWLNADPCYDDLRDQPRFQEIVKRVGLPG